MKKLLISLIVFVAMATSSSYAWTYYDVNDYHAIVNAQPNDYHPSYVADPSAYDPNSTSLSLMVFLPYINYQGIYLAMSTGYYGYASFSGCGSSYSISGSSGYYNSLPYSPGSAIDFYVANGAGIIASYY